uniref:Uncharacterized protein n=2 Tax=Pectinophora gossypiella TaxID=13191 RepID=A0A1E1W0H1_PECGO
MSHHGPPHYPHGGPPPPFGSHPPPPAYGYVPAAVAMPVYPPHLADYPHPSPQPQPTYITNHYYPNNNPPPEPVHVVENAMPPPPQYQPVQDYIDWIPSTPNTAAPLTHKAVVAGKEPGWDSSPLWVIRAHHGGDLVPGKLAIRDRRAYIPIAGQEIPVHNFEVLCAPAHIIRWLPASNGQVPVGAIPGGNTHSGETLYIGRVRYNRSTTPGKVHPSHGCLYISFGGIEVPHRSYEVLCRVVG